MTKAMNCTTAEDFIQRGVDGRLTLDERQALDGHLDSCAACRAEWEAQRRLAQVADRWARPTPVDDPGEAFTAAVLAQIAARPQLASRRQSYYFSYHFWLPLAALLCLGIVLALLPFVSWSNWSALALSAQQLPHWLLSNLHAIPKDAQALTDTLTRAPSGLAVPHYAWAVLLLVLALNSAFCVHARRAQRSFS